MDYPWKDLMTEWNESLFNSKSLASRISQDAKTKRWLGYQGVTDSELLALETRLKSELPTSYKEFLRFSNGWQILGYSIFNVWDTKRVNWFYVNNQQWIDAWSPGGKDTEGLSHTLEVSDRGDAAIFLLNPKVRSSSGEWEALFFTNWVGQVIRKKSFWELMTYQYERFKYIDKKRDERNSS